MNSNESNPDNFIGSTVTLICTVKLSVAIVFQNPSRDINIKWTVPDGSIITDELFNNEQSTIVNNNTCHRQSDTYVFKCENSTYKRIVTVTPLTPGFYNCTANIMDIHPYINMELSNGTRFPNGQQVSIMIQVSSAFTVLMYTSQVSISPLTMDFYSMAALLHTLVLVSKMLTILTL